jgi:hypothetical protein
MPNTDHDNCGKIVAGPRGSAFPYPPEDRHLTLADGHPRRCRIHHAGHEGTP